MDPNAVLQRWAVAVLEEDREEANEAYEALRAWIERGGFEPSAFEEPWRRRQFFSYSPRTGRIGE